MVFPIYCVHFCQANNYCKEAYCCLRKDYYMKLTKPTKKTKYFSQINMLMVDLLAAVYGECPGDYTKCPGTYTDCSGKYLSC